MVFRRRPRVSAFVSKPTNRDVAFVALLDGEATAFALETLSWAILRGVGGGLVFRALARDHILPLGDRADELERAQRHDDLIRSRLDKRLLRAELQTRCQTIAGTAL